ncbi:MAG: AraC family transcriptional regulator [Rubrivivax sp.]|nr:AraC family transcriptional regulator [Rubrivivax sp.]
MPTRFVSLLALSWALLALLLLALVLALPAQAAEAVPAAVSAPAAPAAPASATQNVAAPAVAASAPAAAAEPAALDARVQQLKADVIRLNRDLLVLEEELLYPAGTQVALFVSMDVGKLFELESLQVKLGDKLVATHLYTPLEVQALHRGGVQRVYVGNLRAGKHQITAFFTGRGPHERDYKRGTTLEFDKGTEPRYIELRIRDVQARLQPDFEVKVW